MRDFVLFAHRRIGADLIRQQGPHLDTVSTYLSSCPDETLKRAWLRRALAATSDTSQFAERIAHAYEQARACPPRHNEFSPQLPGRRLPAVVRRPACPGRAA
ncbi:hypothetical protein [Massilia sp. Se16.2.3]|uniref:hypothetical protein n=1 Tax=Massilia sp. Se16.2.3 TaxID=2709303 RepID=UPI001601D750|nr:hypothetical protein [Massilia sp. Se16.2.3]QNA98679.1 hypothetical protein G4G31_07275 [Massilia sp. Se16.2.3]